LGESSTQAAEQRWRMLCERSLAGVFRIDMDGRVQDANPALARMLGYASVEELFRLPAWEWYRCGPDGCDLREWLNRDHVIPSVELRLERSDGTPMWVLASAALVEEAGSPAFIEGTVVDLTEAKRAREKILHLNRLYSMLSHLDQAIVRSGGQDQLFREACRVAVEDGGFRMAWIGLLNPETRVVEPVARYGFEEGYLDGLKITVAEEAEGAGPTGRALREGRHFVCNDIAGDTTMLPWKDAAVERGYRSSAAFPIRTEGKPTGAFSLYAADSGLFDDETLALLQEIADDLGFALENMHRDELRRNAEYERARLSASEQAARAQAKAEARFRELLEAAPDAILEIDRSGRIILLNPAAERLFGYSRDELLGETLETLVPEPLRERHVARRTEYMQRPVSRAVTQGRELCARRKDGAEIPVEISLSPVRSESGDLVTCIVRDITHRKRAEEAQRESAQRIASILESITDGFLALDREWRFTYLNHRAEQLLERQSAELIGTSIWEQLPDLPGSVFHAECLRAVAEGVPVEFSTACAGGKLWVDVHAYPSESGLSVYLQDITERKQLEERFRQSQKLEALGRLAGGVAHDFNNLLTIIGGYSQMVLDALPNRSPLHKDLEAVAEAANRASALTRQLLAFSRHQMVEPKILDLNRLVEKTNRMLRRVIGEDIDLCLALTPGLGRVRADPSQLEQVLLNLALNARDAMPQGGKLSIETSEVVLEGHFSLAPPELLPGAYLVLSIADTGTGMDASVRSRIFEPFFTTKTKGRGTGLGLAATYGIIKQSGGDILVDTELGKGTTFQIYLPRVDRAVKTSRGAAPGKRSPRRGTETILLVEDEATVRKLVREMLAALGYKVIEASSGTEALRAWEAARGAVQLLVTDIIMPQMSGPQLARELTLAQPGLRVLFVSGYTSETIARHGVDISDASLLAKPFTREALGAKVRELLDGAAGPRAHAN
jgi:PAS domain S-box-containing protein